MNPSKEPQVATQLRLPVTLHAALRALADAEERSLNNLMVRLLREGVDRHTKTAEPPAD